MTQGARARCLRWGLITLAAIGACSPLKNRSNRPNGRAGSQAVSIGAGAGAPGKTSERDASAEDASDAGVGEREKVDAGGRDNVGVGAAVAGSGGSGSPATTAGSGGSSGASGAGGAAGMTAPMAGAPATAPDPGPLKRPTVCPASGEVQLNWRDAMLPLPGSGAEFLHLLGDGECAGPPLATTVSAKLQLINRTNMPQTAECWLSSTKASDYVKPQLAAREIINVFLQVANPAGGAEHANAATVMCRSGGPAAGELAVTGIKLITEALTAAEVLEVK